MPHLVATLIYLLQNYSYYIRGDRSLLKTCISECKIFRYRLTNLIALTIMTMENRKLFSHIEMWTPLYDDTWKNVISLELKMTQLGLYTFHLL